MDNRIEAVQSMQDYIEKHSDETITPSALAKATHFSPWYAARIFKELTGYAPADYIRRLRLSKSALRLRDHGDKVINVALDAGFESVDGFQRAFRREFGCNPKQYAQSPVPIPLFTAYGVKFRSYYKEVKNMKEVQSVFIQVIEKPAHKVVVKRGIKAEEYWAYCEEVGCEVWGILKSMSTLSGEPVCLYLPPQYQKKGTSKYVQGVEVPLAFNTPIPEGFDIIEFPVQKYLHFQGEPFREEDYCDAIVALKTAIDTYDPTIIGYTWDDDAPRIQLEPIGKRGYIELRAIKAKN